jgi:hypothetical protein
MAKLHYHWLFLLL